VKEEALGRCMPFAVTVLTFVYLLAGTHACFSIPRRSSGMMGSMESNIVIVACIGGIARDTAAVPLEGVLVEVLQSSIVMGQDTSDSGGIYEVGPLDPGIYDAVASKRGYLPDTATGISVSVGCTPVNFELVPSPYECGDCNGDGRTTIADATYLVAYIYRGGPGPVGQGDVNDDGRVTIADATYLVAFIYRGGSTPCESH